MVLIRLVSDLSLGDTNTIRLFLSRVKILCFCLSLEERTKASSGLGNSPRVTLLYKTESASYQSKSCSDALAAGKHTS